MGYQGGDCIWGDKDGRSLDAEMKGGKVIITIYDIFTGTVYTSTVPSYPPAPKFRGYEPAYHRQG